MSRRGAAQYRLHFSGEREGLFFLFVEEDGASFACDAPFGQETAFGEPAGTALKAGVYRVRLKPAPAARDVTLRCGGCVPFLMPGPGIVPSHFAKPVPPLRLAGGEAYELTIPVPEARSVYFSYCSAGAPPRIALYDGLNESDQTEALAPRWLPDCAAPYHSARLAPRSGALTARVTTAAPTRLTVWEGDPILLGRPERPLPTGTLRLSARDEAGEPLDARFEVYVGGELVLQRDVLRGEEGAATLPEGAYTVLVHHGGRFSRACRSVVLRAGETARVSATLRELLPLPKGWVWGDEHVHSVFEDGAPLPDMIMRAARATGSNFAFVTDHQVKELIDFGVSCADEPGLFLGLAGQEIVCHELHMNVLNAPRAAEPAMLPYDRPNADILGLIQGWLDQIDGMKAERPVTFMLNHPHHADAVRSNPALGYFRSWWVHDRFPRFGIVENFDFQSWFDRLNRGERLTGVWTTDSHDCSRMYAGRKGTCLYAGGGLTAENLIDALDKGHAFSARWPGATLFLTVNGAMMGDELRVAAGERCAARIEAASVLPLRDVELVVNGYVASVVPAHGATALTAEIDLPEDALWAVARLRLEGGDWPQEDHSFEPLMVSGYAAFTNPVYILRETSHE